MRTEHFRDYINRLQSGEDTLDLIGEIMFDFFAEPIGQHKSGGPMGYVWPDDNPSWNFAIRFPGQTREWFDRDKRDTEPKVVIWRDDAWVLVNTMRLMKITTNFDDAIKLIGDTCYEIDAVMTNEWSSIMIWIKYEPKPVMGFARGINSARALVSAIMEACLKIE